MCRSCFCVLLKLALVALSLSWAACSPSDPQYSTPALTWKTYVRAVAHGDAQAAWACFSPSYQSYQYGADPTQWATELERQGADMKRGNKRCAIVEERILTKRLAYLLFDADALPSDRKSPFVYFLLDRGNWRMTTHVDTVFHRELERAIARGEYRLPDGD